MVLVTQPQERLSKSNAQIGHSIRAQRATWAQFSFGSFLRVVFNQFGMAGGLAYLKSLIQNQFLDEHLIENGFGQQPVAL